MIFTWCVIHLYAHAANWDQTKSSKRVFPKVRFLNTHAAKPAIYTVNFWTVAVCNIVIPSPRSTMAKSIYSLFLSHCLLYSHILYICGHSIHAQMHITISIEHSTLHSRALLIPYILTICVWDRTYIYTIGMYWASVIDFIRFQKMDSNWAQTHRRI